MSVIDFLVLYADPLLAFGTFVFTVGLFFLIRSGVGKNIPLSASAVAGTGLWLHVIVFLALGFYYTSFIVAVRAIMWLFTSVQRVRKLRKVTL